MIIVTQDLIHRLRMWTDQGNHFYAMVNGNKYPELLPGNEACEYHFFEICSVDELVENMELASIHVNTAEIEITYRIDDEASLRCCDWQLAITVTAKEYYERKLAQAKSFLDAYLSSKVIMPEFAASIGGEEN